MKGFRTILVLSFISLTLNVLKAQESVSSIEYTQKARVFKNLKRAIKKPNRVYGLDLSNQGLEEFPIEILTLKNLRFLNLSNNKLKDIPDELDKLRYLEHLDLSSNKIRTVNQSVGNLHQLINLIINKNRIENLPDNLFDLPRIKTLIISDNFLSQQDMKRLNRAFQGSLIVTEIIK